jgi:NAD(P)H-hydrate epimerase
VRYVTAEQMRNVDELVIKEYHISLFQMMELAGSSLATLVKSLFQKPIKTHKILILAGKGNNGGGGLVAARHLHNWGYEASVVFSNKTNLKPAMIHHKKTLMKIGVPMFFFDDYPMNIFKETDLILDCLLGYNTVSDPRPPINQLIKKANQSGKSILSLDLPSGLNATTGKPGNPCIRASYTLTLALPKTGLKTKTGKEHVGELFLADIGLPPKLYSELGLEVGHIFEKERIIKISG